MLGRPAQGESLCKGLDLAERGRDWDCADVNWEETAEGERGCCTSGRGLVLSVWRGDRVCGCLTRECRAGEEGDSRGFGLLVCLAPSADAEPD